MVVENRTGSSGNIGTENVVRSAPDGHTLLMGTSGALTVNPHLFPNLGFDPATRPGAGLPRLHHRQRADREPQRAGADGGGVPGARAVAAGALSYGSAGAGSSTHMAAELFRLAAGIQVLHVPYRGSAPALNDTVAGNVQFMVDQLASCIGQIRAGSVRALAVTGPRRSPLLPDVPTVAEAGLPGAENTSWGAVLVPAGTPERGDRAPGRGGAGCAGGAGGPGAHGAGRGGRGVVLARRAGGADAPRSGALGQGGQGSGHLPRLTRRRAGGHAR